MKIVGVAHSIERRFVKIPKRVYLHVVHACIEHSLQHRVPARRLDARVMHGAAEEQRAAAIDDEAAAVVGDVVWATAYIVVGEGARGRGDGSRAADK